MAASYRGEARCLWINASPRERSLVKFHLSEFRIRKGFSPWGNRGSVACHQLRMKTSATYPQPQVASQHLDGTSTRRPSPLPTAMLVWSTYLQVRVVVYFMQSRGLKQWWYIVKRHRTSSAMLLTFWIINLLSLFRKDVNFLCNLIIENYQKRQIYLYVLRKIQHADWSFKIQKMGNVIEA